VGRDCGSGVAAGRVSSDSVATARALALALVPQRRVGVAIVMMWDAAEGKGAFRCGLLLRLRRGLPHWLWAVACSLAALYPCLASASARRGQRNGAASQPNGQRWDEAAGFTVRLVGLIRFRVSGVE
jgi:hypothetical protein